MATKKYRILFVDDEEENLAVIGVLLGRFYDVKTASGGKEALEILAENSNIDLIISDQRMPEMTGIEFLKEVQRLYPKIIRVILTGYGSTLEIEGALEDGVIKNWFQKPWDFSQMKGMIDQFSIDEDE